MILLYENIRGEQHRHLLPAATSFAVTDNLPSHEAYQWMVDFVDEVVTPADENAAEKLSIALNGKGAFRRFKDTLHRVDDQWLQAWYQWRDKQVKATVDEWLKSVLSPDE